MRNLFLIFFLALIFIGCNTQPKPKLAQITVEDSIAESINNNAIQVLELSTMKSLSIGVLVNDSSYIKHYGDLERGKGIKPNNETLYEIASVTKTFTGTLSAKAVLDGKIKLDDDIRDFLTGDYPNLSYQGKPIKVRDLLSHTSGLPSNNKGFSSIPSGLNFTEMSKRMHEIESKQTKDKFFNFLEEITIDSLPGSDFNYSNYGTNLMAAIIENVYSEPFQDLVHKEIFTKAGMTSTKFNLTPEETKYLAPGYNERDEKMHHLTLGSTLWGAEGGIKSTMPDMIKYMKLQMDLNNKMAVESHNKIKEMDPLYSFGYFWWIIGAQGKDLHYRHDGGAPGTRGVLILYPDSQIGIYTVTNVVGKSIFDDLAELNKNIYKEIKSNNQNLSDRVN